MKMLSFEVIGTPAPAGSKKAFVVKGRPVVVDSSGAAGRQWRNAVQAAALRAVEATSWQVSRVPLGVKLTIHLPRPKGHFGAKGNLLKSAPVYPAVRPDLTKLARAIEDALTGIIWYDDAQIVYQTHCKHYLQPGEVPRVTIEVREMP